MYSPTQVADTLLGLIPPPHWYKGHVSFLTIRPTLGGGGGYDLHPVWGDRITPAMWEGWVGGVVVPQALAIPSIPQYTSSVSTLAGCGRDDWGEVKLITWRWGWFYRGGGGFAEVEVTTLTTFICSVHPWCLIPSLDPAMAACQREVGQRACLT